MTYDEFIAHRLGSLLRFATAVTCDPHLAEDVVQDVLVRAHGRWARIAAMEQPEAYLKRMVVNEFISSRRRSARVVPLATEALATAAPSYPDHAVVHGERDVLMRHIAGLTPKQRAVVALRYYDGMRDTEIALALGCSETTVRTHASRALAALRGAMARTSGKERS
jgi:RNA polymerase sigma-70 factor (sigma-E family)